MSGFQVIWVNVHIFLTKGTVPFVRFLYTVFKKMTRGRFGAIRNEDTK